MLLGIHACGVSAETRAGDRALKNEGQNPSFVGPTGSGKAFREHSSCSRLATDSVLPPKAVLGSRFRNTCAHCPGSGWSKSSGQEHLAFGSGRILSLPNFAVAATIWYDQTQVFLRNSIFTAFQDENALGFDQVKRCTVFMKTNYIVAIRRKQGPDWVVFDMRMTRLRALRIGADQGDEARCF